MTRWAVEVTPENVHGEYPRPQLVREPWQNLNGLWDYAITPLDGKPSQWAGQILVPFPLESALSGVAQNLDEKSLLWYRRRFSIPETWKGQQVRLHFGAVDWQATVYVNGRRIGVHRGGYDAFTFDITDALTWSGPEEIVVTVFDPTAAEQPRGKQSRHPQGIFYAASSGIWQTVWLEPVSKYGIEEVKLQPDLDQQALNLRVVTRGPGSDEGLYNLGVEVIAMANGTNVATVKGKPNTEMILALPNPHVWSPNDPFLYDLKIILRSKQQVVDTATSYFGMRKVALGKDSDGVTRIALNNKFVFQAGVLDQGFWPDGLYTAPSDAALRNDIEVMRELGFNLVRKYVKAEPDRWYYWCDKLGLLVWQDMPCANAMSSEARYQFESELQQMVYNLGNHPSIIMWVVFNEGWGQYDTERLARWVKQLDPSRLVDAASGWNDFHVGDVVDVHSYPRLITPIPEMMRAAVLGEFGGLGLNFPTQQWSPQSWNYLGFTKTTEFGTNYSGLWQHIVQLKKQSGLSAAVYTQLTDVETECDGLQTYDRSVIKVRKRDSRVLNQVKQP